METIKIDYNGNNYSFPYERKEDDYKTIINITIEDEEISKLVGMVLTITLNNRDNILSSSPTLPSGLDIKNQIAREIFQKEGIDFLV